MTAKILPRFKQRINNFTLIPSRGGCFELIVEGKLLYSKLKTGRFPDESALLEAIDRALGD